MKPLMTDKKCEFIETSLNYPNLVRVRSIHGASSLLHACLLAYFVPYRMNKFNNKPFLRQTMVETMRIALANKLTEPFDPSQRMDVLVYDTLLQGKCRDICESCTLYSLPVMESELRDPSFFLDDKYLELIANFIKKDIYIIDASTKDLWVREEDESIFFKKRGSIVLLALDQHFEVIGIAKNGNLNDVVTHFDPDSNFIKFLRERYHSKQTILKEQ